MPDPKHAILLLAHGTPDRLSEMAEYLHHVTGGRPMPAHVVEELQHRYGEIGLREEPLPEGPPLTRLTLQQGRLLQEALAAQGDPRKVYVGMRNWHPFIADVVAQMKADGVTHATVLCLAPQYSRTSTGLYKRALQSALAATGTPFTFDFIAGWADEPLLAQAFAERLTPALTEARAAATRTAMLFTAHSVPCRTIMTPATAGAPGPDSRTQASASTLSSQSEPPPNLSSRPEPPPNLSSQSEPPPNLSSRPDPERAEGAVERPAVPAANPDGPPPADGIQNYGPAAAPDPYPVECKQTAAAIAAHAGLSADQWFFAFQSQGIAGAPWIGPTVEDTMQALCDSGYKAVVVQPVGFLCDHVEILYDIDINFREVAHGMGMQLFRPASLNDSATLTQALMQALQRPVAS